MSALVLSVLLMVAQPASSPYEQIEFKGSDVANGERECMYWAYPREGDHPELVVMVIEEYEVCPLPPGQQAMHPNAQYPHTDRDVRRY